MDDYTQANAQAIAQLTAPGAPFEVVTTHYNGVPLKAYKNAAKTLNELMAPGRNFGDALFLQYPSQEWTFNAFWRSTDALAANMATTLGIKPGARVAIAMRNRPEWLVAFTAILQVGAVVVPLNSWGKGDELNQGLIDSDAQLLICDHQRYGYVRDAGNRVPAIVVDAPMEDDTADYHWQQMLNANHPLPDIAIDTHDPAILLFTSGTSGRPKGALFSHFSACQALMNVEFIGACTFMTNTDAMTRIMSSGVPAKTLLAVPLFHISGLFSQFVINLRLGRGLYIMYKWDAEEALRLIRTEGITVLMGAPVMLLELLGREDFTAEDAANITNISAGGAATPDILHELFLNKVQQGLAGAGWGMTETAGTGAAFTGRYMHDRPGSSGFVSPIVELSFHDENGNPIAEGEPGEIWIRSSAAIQRYVSGVADDSDFNNGWLKTGDVGYVSNEGLLYLSGRVKDMIIRGGENIYPAEIEACLLTLPGCIEAAVVGVPSDHWGEEVGAVLRMEDAIDARVVQAYCSTRLAGFKVPSRVAFTSEPLPRNAVQKLLKKPIQARYFPS